MLFIKRFLASLFISSLSGILIFVLVYFIAVTISPPEFIDEGTGEVRRVMPLGQVMLATFIAAGSGFVLLIAVYRSYPKIIARLGRKRA